LNTLNGLLRQLFTLISFSLAALLFVPVAHAAISDYFIFTVKTDITTSTDKGFQLPLYGGSTYIFEVDCDGNDTEFGWDLVTSSNKQCLYASPGTYTIFIRDATGKKTGFPRFKFGLTDSDKLMTHDQWGTSKWTSMYEAFLSAKNLTTTAADIPDFSGVTDFTSMFRQASKVNPTTSGWNTTNVTTMSQMFWSALVANPDTSGWNTSNVTSMYAMFSGAKLAKPDTSGWNTTQVINMRYMFSSASLANPNTSGWNTSQVKTMQAMFKSAKNAQPDTSGWDTGSVTTMQDMFRSAPKANPDTSGWNTAIVENMNSMFYGATLAQPITTTRGNIWNTSAVKTFAYMFKDAKAAEPDTAGWVTDSVTSMIEMFYGATKANPNTSNWNTANVKNMQEMFRDASIAQPDTSNWDTSQVTTTREMFYKATLANPDTSGWNTSNITDMVYMFRGAYAAKPDTRGWDTAKVTGLGLMFYMKNTSGNTSVIDPDMSNWSIKQLSQTNLTTLLEGATLSTQNYDKLIIAWKAKVDSSAFVKNPFGAGFSKYCIAKPQYDVLTSTDSWKINDGGYDCSSVAPDLIDASDSGISNVDDLTSISTPTFSVYCPANGATVKLFSDAVKVGTYDCTAEAYVEVTASALADGNRIITFTTTESGTESAPYPSLNVTVNSTMANLRTPNLLPASDTGTSNIDNITSLTSLDFAVYCPTTSSALRLMYDNGSGDMKMANTTCSAIGWQTITATGVWPDGLSNVSVIELNNSLVEIARSQTPLALTVQTGLPTVALTQDKITTASTNLGKTLITGQVSGNFTTGDTVSLLVNGVTYNGLVDSEGNYSIEINQADLAADADNSIDASISITDSFGNNASANDSQIVTDHSGTFIFTIDTNKTGITGNLQYKLPLFAANSYDVYCDSNDLTNTLSAGDPMTCIYSSPGIYTITYADTSVGQTGFERFRFNNGDAAKLLTHDQWGSSQWTNMADAFLSASNLTTTAADTPDFSNVKTMLSMFDGAPRAIPTTTTWNTSNVTNMSRLFRNASAATPDTSNWDTSNVTTMLRMFDSARKATPDTSTWNTAKVTDMSYMFYNAKLATPVTTTSGGIWNTSAVTNMTEMFANASNAAPDTTGWDTSSVKTMNGMFRRAFDAMPDTSSWDTSSVTAMNEMFDTTKLANPDTSGWNTASVTDMSDMFDDAEAANPDTSSWDTSSVTDMSRMFALASLVDPVVTSWDITKVTDMSEMFAGVKLPTSSYDTLLTHWDSQLVTAAVPFNGGLSNYCYAVSERTDLTDNQTWTITDGGHDCSALTPATTPDLLAISDLGLSDTDDITSLTTPSFELYCPTADTIITPYSDNPASNTAINITYNCTAVGNVNVPATTLAPGLHNVSYTQTINGSTTGHSPALAVTIDLAPTLTISANTATLIAGQTSLVTFDFSELVTGFDLADITVTNGTLTNLVKTTGLNQWTATFTPNSPLDTTNAVNIVEVASASYIDSTGQTGTGAVLTMTIDTVLPSPIITVDSSSLVTGTNAQGSVIAVTGQVTGDFNENDPITLIVNGQTYSGTVDATGNFSIAVNEADLLTNSTITASVSTTDSSGNNATASTNKAVTVDYAPTLTISADSSALNAQTTSIITFAFNEVVSGFELNDIVLTNGSLSDFAKTTGENKWTAKFTPVLDFEGQATIIVADGVYFDTSSNTGKGAQTNITIDSKLPVATITIDPSSLVTGTNPQGNVVTVTGQVSGDFNENDPITLTVNGQTYSGTVDATGNFSIAVNEADLLTNSTITASISTTDSAGNNATASTNKAVTIDSSPTLTITTNNDKVLIDQTSVISFEFSEAVTGFALNDITVTKGSLTNLVKTTGQNIWTATYTPPINDNGTGGITIAVTDGSYVDSVGSLGQGSELNFAIDTLAPVVTIEVNDIDRTAIVDHPQGLSLAVTGQVSGDFSAGDVVTLVINGQTYSGPVDDQGKFSIAVLFSDLNASDEINSSITVTDESGNSHQATDKKSYVANFNESPVANAQSVTTPTATAVAIELTASDSNDDALIYVITQPPAHGVLTGSGANLTYTPTADFNGNDSFTFTVTDPLQGTSDAIVSINVEAPAVSLLAVDDLFTIDSWQPVMLDVLTNDIIDPNMIVVLQAATTFGQLSIVDNKIEYSPAQNLTGDVQLTYTISSNGNTSNAVITVSFPDELAPEITVPADLCDDLSVNSNALYTKVNLGEATALDRFGNPLPVSLVDGRLLYPAGINKAYWQAIDSYGVKSIKAQTVCVHPLVSLRKDQNILRGEPMRIGVYLNGESPVYPLTVTYGVTSGSNAQMQPLGSGQIIIEQGTESVIDIAALTALLPQSDNLISVELTNNVNVGSKSSHLITLSQEKPAPLVSFNVVQNDQQRFMLAKDQGLVTITATYPDVDDYQGYNLTWTHNGQAMANSSLISNQLTFELSNFAIGYTTLSAHITDNNGKVLGTDDRIDLVIVEQLQPLENVDSDGDLVSDIEEGFKDSDGDFIPDYLDRIDECNVLQQNQAQFDGYLIEGNAGFCLRRGNLTIGGEGGGAQISNKDFDSPVSDTLVVDDQATNVGGIFDFIAYGSMTQGNSLAIAIPQRKPIPPAAVYRKLLPTGQWQDYVEDDNNSLWSTAGEPGYCPPPNTNSGASNPWQPGLIAGYWCVQLLIEDGGGNDDDKLFNGKIIDPGGVAIPNNGNTLPTAVDDVAQLDQFHQADIEVLANDTDGDNDTLTITSASVSIGSVTFDDSHVYYQGDASYAGDITIYYGISDGQGGTDIGTIIVSAYVNMPPVATADQATTDNLSAITIDVLANDSDVEGGELQLQLLGTDNGTVTLVDKKIHFVPTPQFVGLATVQYQLADPQGAIAIGQLKVNVIGSGGIKSSTSGGDGRSLVLLLMLAYWLRLLAFSKTSTVNNRR